MYWDRIEANKYLQAGQFVQINKIIYGEIFKKFYVIMQFQGFLTSLSFCQIETNILDASTHLYKRVSISIG